jgi:hypothetical protein
MKTVEIWSCSHGVTSILTHQREVPAFRTSFAKERI